MNTSHEVIHPKGLSEKMRKTCSDSFFSAVFAYSFNETGANARDVQDKPPGHPLTPVKKIP
jgi:hypothetical protein